MSVHQIVPSDLTTMSLGVLIFLPCQCEASTVTLPSGSKRHTVREPQPATTMRPSVSRVRPLALVEGAYSVSIPTCGRQRMIRSHPGAAWLTSSAYMLESQDAPCVRGEDGVLLLGGQAEALDNADRGGQE